MQLTDDQLRDLAATFACRLMPERFGMASAPSGRHPRSVWLESLRTAHEHGTLRPLVRDVAASRPEDGLLQVVCADLTGEPTHWESVTLGATLLAAVVGLVLVMGGGMATAGVLAALEHPSGAHLVGSAAQFVHVSAGRAAAQLPVHRTGGPSTADAVTGGRPPPPIAATSVAGDDRPAAAAPMGPPDMPMSGARTRAPRVEDGPPEGSLESLPSQSGLRLANSAGLSAAQLLR